MTRYVAPNVTIVRDGARRRGPARRRSSSTLGSVGGIARGLPLAAFAGAAIGGKLVSSGMVLSIPGYQTLKGHAGAAGALGLLMFGAGHFLKMPLLKRASVGPLCASLYMWGSTGTLGGDGEDDISGGL